ncbi:MAG: hypothetical protein ACLR23_23895 [Clostridia bacterium]
MEHRMQNDLNSDVAKVEGISPLSNDFLYGIGLVVCAVVAVQAARLSTVCKITGYSQR